MRKYVDATPLNLSIQEHYYIYYPFRLTVIKTNLFSAVHRHRLRRVSMNIQIIHILFIL